MLTKSPPAVLTTEKLSFMSTLNEYQRRRYLGTEALAFGKRGVDKISQFFGVSKNTVYSSIEEIESGYSPNPGHIRRPGGGRKALLSRHPEWIDTLKLVIAPHVAGLPQDENVIWVSMSVPMIAKEMSRRGCDTSEYIVRQILDSLGFPATSKGMERLWPSVIPSPLTATSPRSLTVRLSLMASAMSRRMWDT